MASDVDKENQGGDSARSPRCSSSCAEELRSHHVVNAAGESLAYQHSSDSESLGSRKSKTRYINPAIYVETIEASHSVVSLNGSVHEDITPHPHTTYRSNSTPYLSGRQSDCSSASGCITRKSCRLALDTERLSDDEEDTERIDKTYREDGQDTFRLSVASMSTTTTTNEERERNEAKRKQAFKEWCARKEQERAERVRQEKDKGPEQQRPQARVSREEREESFRKWMERKRSLTDRRKAEEIMRKFRLSERVEEERRRKESEKEERLGRWIKKKEEETKEIKSRQEREMALAAMAEEKRRSAGERAYRDWLRTSKNKPLPVPLNRGELSMRGSTSDMYINPVPWQSPT